MSGDQLQEIIKRLERLEKSVFSRNSQRENDTRSEDDFAGLKGGLRLLVSRGFFRTKKTLPETRQEIEKHGYHYSAPAIQTSLNRLSTRTGPLATFKEGGRKVYVRRK